MAKIINYKAKISRSLANIVKFDPEIITLEPNENAITSNLFRRVQKKKNHFIEMEYDKYEIKSNIIAELMNPTRSSEKKYKPKPDIIAHYQERNTNSIILIAEAKKFYGDAQSITNVVNDYYKIWGYKIATNVQQGILIIYPMNNSGSLRYKKTVDIYNEAQLKRELTTWGPKQLGAINIIFNQSELSRIVKDKLVGKQVYKEETINHFIIIDGLEKYLISFDIDSRGSMTKTVKQVNNEVSTSDRRVSYRDKIFEEIIDDKLIYETPNSKLATLIRQSSFDLKNQTGVSFEHNVFFNNAMLKFSILNEDIESVEIRDKKRNLLIIAYTLEYGFVFGMRNVNLPKDDVFVKVRLKFGYEPGETWTYFALKDNNKFVHNPETIMSFLKGPNPTKIINLKKISKEIKLEMDWD